MFACAPSKEKICGKIDDSIRNYLEKSASKANKDLTIHALKTTDFSLVGAGRLDTLSKESYNKKITYFSQRYTASGNAAKADLDSINYYAKLDSLTTLQIANRWQDPQVYYYSKTYLSATMGTVKTADTMRYALDRTFKLIPIL
ncbi:hypothetical protein GO730_03155 [Spirosoma sp. HMF3257]|uniref:Uncharacterized protein n=1 Tax=Spirosoma telluris TaxID=2183553 RepID=A0A327NM29_9BACT|nr:hypothetical protein [Spirosoma telluris]RAI73658.1 hypothetical protein HMF3257_03085 [Spirosoma telluris]